MKKICPKCNDPKIQEEYRANKTRKDGLQSWCRECEDKNKRRWYADNRDHAKARVAKTRAVAIKNARVWAREHLEKNPCVDCGERDIIVLDFDHVTGVKEAHIATMICSGVSVEKVAKEAKKCVIRCANCHRRKTAKLGNHWRYKIQGVV